MVASLTLITTAILLTLQPALAYTSGTSSNNIFARQLGGLDAGAIPPSCLQDSCQTLETVITSDNCTTPQCVCTTTVANGLKSCIQCAVTAGVAGYTQASADNAINQFISGCSQAGFSISGVSTSGGSSSSSGGSATATATGLGATSATASNTATAATSTGTTSPIKIGAASKINVGTFGVIITAALGVIAFL